MELLKYADSPNFQTASGCADNFLGAGFKSALSNIVIASNIVTDVASCAAPRLKPFRDQGPLVERL